MRWSSLFSRRAAGFRWRCVFPALLLPAAGAAAAEPPAAWIDPDTGHRVIRLTSEPGSASFYFNENGYTPDGREMVYTTPAGISVLDLSTLRSRPVVAAPAKAIAVGHKTPTLYFTRQTDALYGTLWSVNLDTGATRKLADLPRRGVIAAINADETLAGGTYIVGDGADYGGAATVQAHPLEQPVEKGRMMADRLAARLPMVIYTVDLATGTNRAVVAGTDWLDHVDFSPTDPTLLLYCHQGAWHQVEKLWTVRTDGSENQSIHHRTMEREGIGHQWWTPDGSNIWYDLQMPAGVVSYIAGYNVTTGSRIWYHYDAGQASIHFNASHDGALFCGDGGKQPGGQWIFLFHPERIPSDHTLGKDLIQVGVLHSERLVSMAKHRYILEPNASFTPDNKLVVFRSNMFGPTYTFGVEVAKAGAPPAL